MRAAKLGLAIPACLLWGLLVPTLSSAGGWGVSGGDGVMLAFQSAKEHAAQLTLRLKPEAIGPYVRADVREWLIENQLQLAADIAASRHLRIDDVRPTCAATDQHPGADIFIAINICRANIKGTDEAGQLLIHEAVHHFGISDEEFADLVAMAVYDTWRRGAMDWLPLGDHGDVPEARWAHAAVWTGKEMIVQGGITQYRHGSAEITASTYAYDPVRGEWRRLASDGAPKRYGQEAVWIGNKMVVWGGYNQYGQRRTWQNQGAIYDPASNSWSTLAIPFGPSELQDLGTVDERPVQRLVYTGHALIVVGGIIDQNGTPGGGVYDLASKQWRALPRALAPALYGGHTALWTGERLLVWGGIDAKRQRLATGMILDPQQQTWQPMSEAKGLTAREGHTALWTGSRMIIFSGFDNAAEVLGTGAVYDPETDRWALLETEAAQARIGHTANYTGGEMLVFGGRAKRKALKAVAAYNPGGHSWRVVESAGGISGRYQHTAVWTGSALIVFGGRSGSNAQSPGGEAVPGGGVFFP